MIPPQVPQIARSLAPSSPERSKLREAAQGFEAIFVRQLLAAARSASLADDSPFHGKGVQQFAALRDAQFAEIAATQQGLGLAHSIEAQLAEHIARAER